MRKYRAPKLEAVKLTVRLEWQCQCGVLVGGGAGSGKPNNS